MQNITEKIATRNFMQQSAHKQRLREEDSNIFSKSQSYEEETNVIQRHTVECNREHAMDMHRTIYIAKI